MSFGSASRGSRSGGKGTTAKKAKKQKRDFKTSKKRAVKDEKIDVEAAKTRVLEGLTHLGQQKFSTGPGGYDLKHWVKSLNLLLDDFEAKAKNEELPADYLERRKEVAVKFSSGVDTAGIETEVEAIRKEESEIRSTLDRENERIIAKLSSLRVEKEGRAKEIAEQKAELHGLMEKRKSASFFSKLAGRSGPPTGPVEGKIRDLEKTVTSLEEEAVNLQTVRASIERLGGTPSGLYEQQWLRLDAIGARLKELEAQVEERSQLAKERESATRSLSDAVSKFQPKEDQKQK